MSKFFKSLLLLLSAGLFTATGWAVLPEPWAAWDPIQTGAPLVNTTVGGVSSSGWRMNVGGGTYSNGMITTSTSGKAPFIDIGNTTTNFGYGNPITLVATINVNTVDAGESICPLITFANWQYNDGFALTLKSVSEEGGIVFGAATSATTSFGSPSLKEKTISVESYTPGTDLKLAIFLSSEGVQLYTVDGTTATLVDTWSDIAYETLRANRITFGAPPDSNATVIFALKGLAIYPNANATTPLDFSAATTTAATISGTVDASKITWEPSEPTAQMDAELMVDQASTLTMDKSITAHTLKIDGTGSLTIATDGTNKLKATTTKISTDTTVEAGAASLGAVTVEDEKTITVADTTTVTSLTTTRGVLATSADMTITRDTGFFSGLKVLKVVGGTLTSDVTDSNGNNLTYGRDVIVTGASSNLVINKGDGTGWNSGNNSITLTKGGTLTYNYRDTLKSPFKMSGGTVKFAANCANGSGRALDVYNSNASVNDFTVTALDGATVENPTVSYITALAEESDTSGSRKILLRDGDMIVDVVETAKLHVVAELISVIGNAGGTRGKLVKNGTGVLELAGLENIHETGTNINAGVLILSNQATLGSGTTTIAENAQLVIKQGANKLSNAITNNGTITADTATVDLTGVTISGSGTYGVTNNGTLILKAGTENGASVTSGTLKLLLSPEQLATGYPADVAEGTKVTFIKAVAEGYETVVENVTQYELPAKDGETLSVTMDSEDGQETAWSDVADANYVYKNATLSIHFTADNQTFTFDNTLGVSLTSLTVTAEDDVTGGTIAFPATEGLVSATNTAINTNVTATGKGALGAVTVANEKTLTLNGPVATSIAGQGKLVKTGSDEITLDGSIANVLSTYEVNAGKVTISRESSANGLSYSGTPSYKVSGGAHLVLHGNDLVGWGREKTDTVAEISGVLEKTYNANETFSGRLLLKDGGELRNSAADNYFKVFNSAIIATEAGATAKITGHSVEMHGGTPAIDVGENATLNGEAKINLAVATKKTGAGTWNQTVKISGASELTIEEGTLVLSIGDAFDPSSSATVTVNGTLESAGTGTTFYRTVLGTGKIFVPAGKFLAIGESERNVTETRSGLSNFAGTLEVAGTFDARSWANREYVIGACDVKVLGGGRIEKYSTSSVAKLNIASGKTLSGAGTIEIPVTFADGATLDTTAGVLTVSGAVTLPSALTVKIAKSQNVAGSVTLLNATNVTNLGGQTVTVMVGETAGTNRYALVHEDGVLKLTVTEPPKVDAFTATVAGGSLSLTEALGFKALAEGATLTIDFGEGEPGTFTFNNKAAITLTSITIQGTNGGTIVMADGAEIAYETLVLNTMVSADAAFYAANTGVIEGTGKLCLASGELTLDEANTYTGGTEIAAGATLTITNAGAIGTGAITGAGTLVCDGVLPADMTGLATGTPAEGEPPASGWLGTVKLDNMADLSGLNSLNLANYGNANSTIELGNLGSDSTDKLYFPQSTVNIPSDIVISGTVNIRNGYKEGIYNFTGEFSGAGTLTFPYTSRSTSTWNIFGDFSGFTGTLNFPDRTSDAALAKIIFKSESTTTTEFGNGITVADGYALTVNATYPQAIKVLGTIKQGTGTLAGLTLADNATIDTTGGAVKVTGAVTLPSALTVKVAAAPAVGTAVPLLNASNVTISEGMTITVMAGEEEAEGAYQLIKTPTALLLENAPAEDVTIEASNIVAAELYAADQMGNYDSHGVQVDLDGPTPYAPGWVSGVCYPLVSVGVVSDADDRVAAGTCVQVVVTDDPTVVVATSAPFQNENKEDVTVTSSNGTNTYKLYTFKFETPVYVDAAKTYQFRFVNGEGTAVTCKLRALYTSDANGGGDNQRYCNWLNSNYEVITAVATRYVPYTVLTVERVIDNSPILRGGDETLEVTTVPEKIRLDTKTFGYGTHTVLQYTGGETDWDGMSVEGLPEGAEIIKTDTTWGFAIKTLNVLTVGDSITAGLVTYHNSSANWHVPGGYRLPLYKYLTRAGYTVKYLGASDEFGTYSGGNNPSEANPSPSLGDNDHHEGHSGTTLEEAYRRFGEATAQQVIASQGTPDVITLHLGTNDMQTQAQDTDDSVGNQFDEMKKLIYRLNGVCDTSATDDWKAEIGTPLYPNAKIIVAKIIPRGDSDNQSKVEKFNLLLTQYVDDCDSNNLVLVTLPMGEGTSYGYYRHDYLHPSTEGYTQMAKGWFEAIDAKFDPFGKATVAPTPVASTPTTDVTEINPATIGIRNSSNSTAKTIGPFKAAEWTTFAEFKTGYLSQHGYMLDSERPWQLDVRGENEPEVTDGVLSLNGAPITVNPVDGRIGTTVSAYTIVMQVSDLAANDVIFTDSAVQCTDWPNAKGTANADLGVLTVVDEDTLKWTYNGLADGPEIDLVGVNLTDSTPDVIAITVTNNQCKVAVNGGDAVTVSQGSGSETYRGSWSIGARSTADMGSFMKLYRLSFYEGAATVVMPSEITTATINVGEGDGQYITWETAKKALKLSDEMESLTINFTAADQTFTFDNTDVVTIDSVTVQGTAGGTIANAGTATVTATNLAINTNVTMNKCYIVDKNTLPIETTTNIAVAQNCVLTYYINGGQSTVTVAATHSGAGKIAKTSCGTLEITNTCAVNVDVNQGLFKVNVPINGEKKSIENQKTVKLTGSTLILTSGLSYATFDGDETSIIRVDGDYTFGISNSFTNDLDAGEIQIDAGKTLTIRNFKSGYVLSPSKLLRVNGTLQRDGSHGQDFKVSIPATSTLEGSGSITQAIELADGATVHCAATALAVNTVTFAEGTLNVTGADALAEGETVTLFRTTAYAAATGLVEGVVARRAATADETDYRLYKTADAIEVWPSATDAETWTVDAATATTWADVVNQMAAANKRPADTTALTIDFGDIDGEAEPGTFTFGEGDVTLGSLTVIGSNGGTIATTGTVMVSTSAAINTAVAVEGQIQLNGATIAADAELAITNYAVLGTQVSGAGALKITGATLSRGFDADLVSDTWTGTVVLEDVDDNNLDLRYLVNDSITSTEGVLTVTASSSITIEGTVKAYIYDGAIKTLTLNGDFQMANGTTNKSYTQCVTVDNLAGAGAFIGHQSSEVYIAVNVKSWTNFTGSIDLSNEKSKNTIFFFGTAPERFTTSITPGNVGADDSDFTEADYGTIYVTEGDLVTAVGSTWKAPKVNIANGTSLTIQGWFGASESITGLSANTIVGGVTDGENVVEAGVLDLRALADLSGINVTVKAGGRLLVNTGATVPNSIVFEAGSILGVATKHVEDVGNATLTVNVDGTAATTATIKGYHMDGVTLLDNWAKNNETSSEGEFKFNFDPVFDGELCWWAYEFDNEVNTSAESNLGPISTGRDKGRMNFDGRGDSNRVCQDNEYVDHGDGTKAIRVASSPWRNVDGGYPTAFTAAMYGTLTENRNRIIMGFGSSYNQKYTIALVTGASTDEVRLVLQKGWNENNTDYPEDAVITLATTTVPNAVTENHLFAFSYEQFDSEDDDEELDSTRIIFYVDGEKYQPFTAKAIIPLGNGFQMGSIHGGWHNSLTRMNGDDVDCTMEYLRIYDQILPESVWTAMSNEYSYMSKNGRATRTIVAGADTTWNEGTEWTQIRAVKNGEDYVLDAEGHVTFDNGTAVEKPDHGENVGTQVVLNVDGANTLYLNEFYSNPIQIQNGEVSKLYYERLEINPVEGGDEDSLTLWAGRNNPNVADENKNSQSAVITVQGYTKINTNVTMAHNVAFLSGPVAVAEGKWLRFDFSGFDVMKVPSMPVTYRLTGFLDEDTRTRVTSTAPADPVNARSIDLGYKTTVNQYTFTVNRYPVTAYFTADEMAGGNSTDVNFNNLNYVWQGNDLGKQMNWEAEAVDPQGNPIVENTLAKFVSLDAETQKEKMVTVTLATNDAEPITLTLEESDLSKETTPAGTDAEGNPTEAIVEPMLGEQQLIVGNNVIVDYTGNAATLARTLNEASAETTGVIRTAGFTVDAWRANLSVTGGALAGVGKISGKVTFEEGATLDASAATAEACLSAKDADLTNLKAITVDYAAAAGKTLKVLSLPAGHTAKSLIGCTVYAVDGEGETVATWTESNNDPAKVALVVVREDGLYVTGRPVVKAGETEVTNNDLTLPLARRAAELSATSVSLTGVVNMAGESVEASVADAAEVFTNVAFDMTETPVDGVVTAKLKYDFGVSQINVVTSGENQYVVAELIVSNHTDLGQNTAAYANGTTIDVTVKVGDQSVVADKDIVPVADITGADVATAAELPASTRYVRFPMPEGNGTFEIKARAKKAAPAQQQ